MLFFVFTVFTVTLFTYLTLKTFLFAMMFARAFSTNTFYHKLINIIEPNLLLYLGIQLFIVQLPNNFQ